MSSENSGKSKQPPKIDDGDSRLDSFLQRAAPVLAEQRGFNAQSRVKLEAIARDMRLPQNLFDQAMHMLQGAPPVVSKNRWVEAFGRYLHAKLEQSPQHILTAEQHTRAIAVATSKYQLSETQAREVIREVTAERGIRRISQSEAERHITELVAKKAEDAAWLDEQTTKRLHAAGREWGLSDDQVDAIIHQHTQANRRAQVREQRTTKLALVAAGAVIVALLGFFIYATVIKHDADPEDTADGDPATINGPPSTDGGIKRPTSNKPPEWWGKDLTGLMIKARVNVPGFKDLYNTLASPKKDERSAAYDQLTRLCQTNPENGKYLDLLREIVIACYTSDPEDEPATHLRDGILAMISVDEKRLPTDAATYDQAFWALRLLLAALGRENLADDRAAAIEVALGRRLGTVVDRRADAARQEKRCQWLAAKSFYQQLINLGPENPRLAQELHGQLFNHAARHVIQTRDLDRLGAEYLEVMLPAVGPAWQPLAGLIETAIRSDDSLNMLKVVEAYEKTGDLSLQSFIAPRLIRQTGARPRSASVEDVALAVREALGVAPVANTMTARERWELLNPKVDAAVVNPLQSSRDLDGLFDETIQLAHLATLACAVAQQEPGFPLFDQMLADGPPARTDADESRSAFSTPARIPMNASAAKLDELAERIDRLKNFESKNLATRTTDVRGLARLTEHLADIEPQQATVIARYLLTPMDDYEREKVFEAVAPLSHWRHVLLALGDQLPQSPLSRHQAQQVLSTVLGRRVEVEERNGWQLALQEQLQRLVLDDLKRAPAESPTPVRGQIYDNAAVALQKLYVMRARLLGVPPSQYNAVQSPADAQQLVVMRTVERLGVDAGDAPLLEDLSHRLAVIDYLGTNDVRRTVLLQRLGLELLALQLQRRRTDRGSQVQAVVDELIQRDAAADDLLLQLRDGELAILKMWMLHAP